jgi:hypothetical protein
MICNNLLYGSRETFVTLRIVVFETDLKLNGLNEFSFLVLRVLQELFDRASHA